MLEISENISTSKKDEIKDISNLNSIQLNSNSNDEINKVENEKLIYNELIYSYNSSLLPIKYSYNLIALFLNECDIKFGMKIKNKRRMRNLNYLRKKFRNNNSIIKIRKNNNINNENLLLRFFISFNLNIWILLTKYKKDKVESNNKLIVHLNDILKIILNIIGLYYISGNINDDYFELFIKILLDFSLEDLKPNNDNKIRELKNIMFFKESINLIKIIFNKIFFLHGKLSERKKELINNILTHINDNLLGSIDKMNINYSNKYYLSKNDYKTSLLIDLSPIIIKIKSSKIINNFLNLLSTIYSFDLDYINGIKQIYQLLKPIFLNINNKTGEEIKNELELTEFVLNYLNELIKKESKILETDSCMLKQGFYFANEKARINGDINNLENDFFIIFGFRIESEEFDVISLFDIYQNQKTLIKIYLTKNLYGKYELQIEDDKNVNSSKVYVQRGKTYIFDFQFLLKKYKLLKINYIKDNDGANSKAKIHSGNQIKIKNIKQDNLKICIGCKRENDFEPNFVGYMGDIIILNNKHIKEEKDLDIYNDILKLKGNYVEIEKILSNNTLQKDNNYNLEYNSNFNNKSKEILKRLSNNAEFKTNNIINTIISPKYFKLVEYHDDIDYIDSINEKDYMQKLSKPFTLKYKYITNKTKSDSNYKRIFTINSSLFNRYFHFFERKFSLIEFVKYEGIHFLSLIFEYYYQILCHLRERKDIFDTDNLTSVYKMINNKIIKVLIFFKSNIIKTNLYENNINETEQFFHQMVLLIFKFIEVQYLDVNTFKSIFEILNAFDEELKSDKKSQSTIEYLLLIRKNLFEFLINPRLFQEKNDENDNDLINNEIKYELNIEEMDDIKNDIDIKIKNNKNQEINDLLLENLNYVFLSLLTFLKYNKIKNMNLIIKKENLNLLLSYIWLLDKPKTTKIFEIAKNNYISFLVLFLEISSSELFESKKYFSAKNVIIYTEDMEKPQRPKKKLSFHNLSNIKEESLENLFIYQIFKKALEYSQNHYIFFNLSLIIVKTNLISSLKETEISNLKAYFINELKNQEKNYNAEYKRIIYYAYLQILVSYYFSGTNSIGEKNFNEFICHLDLNIDLFYSILTLFQSITNFSKLNNKDIISYETEDLRKINEKDYPTFSDLPMKDLNFKSLNDLDVHIIQNIFHDILILLEKLVKKYKVREKYSNLNNNNSFSSNSDEPIDKDIFEILKKNIDIIFKFPKTGLYETIFSSESGICSKLFEIKWKYGNSKDINYIKTAFKKYFKELVKNIYCPFIYRFLLNISSENLFHNDFKNKNKDTIVLDFKADMFIYIIEVLKDFSNEIKTQTNYMSYYLFNVLNFLIVINKELNYKPNKLFCNEKLCDNLCKLIQLISKGLLFSNYCIDLNQSYGKIISEIIFDLFLAIPEDYFNKVLFNNTFYKSKDGTTIFYIIDRNKEKIISKKRIQNTVNYPELETLKEFHNILHSINKNSRSQYLVEENELYRIEETNYTIYFLAKSFVYLKTNFIKEVENQLRPKLKDKEKGEIKEKALKKLINCLSINLYKLYTRYNVFYETKNCEFPLYDETKRYFESNIIQNFNSKEPKKNSEYYRKFFENDLLVILKNEYALEYCFASKLLKRKVKEIKSKPSDNKSIAETNKSSEEKSKNSSDNTSLNNKNSKDTSIFTFFPKDISSNNSEANLDITEENKSEEEINDKDISIYPENDQYNHSYELIKEKYLILNPRNFFFKKIFSEVYKDLIFKNKTFIDIKNIYIMINKNRKGFTRETKQLDYPSRQKNFSNFLEPRIFIRRDFNYFDKIYFPISFSYLPKTFLNNQFEEMNFYKHEYKYKNEKIKFDLDCELVTNQHILFGKMYFFEKYIIFETKEDPRNNQENDFETFRKYSISTKSKETKIIKKNKFIVIFFNNIAESIKRRTLLITQSIEIFLKNGKSYFFNFFYSDEAQKVYQFFDKIRAKYDFTFDINYNHKEIKNILHQFRDGKISNYFYILYLNKYSTRTYCDLSQYPIFPWLILKRRKIDKIIDYLENDGDKNNEIKAQFRDMRYPISMQNEQKREELIKKYEEESIGERFQSHFNNHYSSSAFVYYFLMRLNPFLQDMIKLQNYENENPNRMFISFESLEYILSFGIENRELIPDFYCYFDYLINLNCNFLGEIEGNAINDDFLINSEESKGDEKGIIPYVHSLYKDKKLLNSTFISKRLHEWVDIIFGKNQIPEDREKMAKSCNIFNKTSYEQKTNFEKKLKKYADLIAKKTIKEKIAIEKMRGKIDMSINLGMTPKQILKLTNTFSKEDFIYITGEFKKTFEDKLIYFEKLPNEEYLFLKDIIKKDRSKIRVISTYIYKNKNLSEIKLYESKQLELMKKYRSITIEQKTQHLKIPLYNPCYSVSYIILKANKKNSKYNNLAILSCRYIENYFNIHTIDKNINVVCEDFVTCIKAKNPEDSFKFYTGLLNGKLIEWKLSHNLEINEIKHSYSHQASITLIEIYHQQNIIITASEDKFIHIRKIYDFEILTVINLTYCFANPIVSKYCNIFPSLVKISELNLLYVLIYDLDSNTNFIRGYNLNGLFISQTDKDIFVLGNHNLIINSISFTKNSNLIIGFYNSNNYSSLNSWDLMPNSLLRFFDMNDKKEKIGTQMIMFDYSSDLFYILYENEFNIKPMSGKDKLECS